MKKRLLLLVGIVVSTTLLAQAPFASSSNEGSCSCSLVANYGTATQGNDFFSSLTSHNFCLVLQAKPTSALISGAVDDCCCSVEVVDDVNDKIRPLLQELTKTTYFRHYKLNLWRKCKIFPEDGQCMFRTCAVEECEEDEWKQIWESEETKEEPEFSRVNSFIEKEGFDTWTEEGDPWTNDMCTAEHDFHYIDLLKNPERFTGYSGPTATRIWNAIYGENCFHSGDVDPTSADICIEKRAFFRLISGLHTSITIHLAYDFLHDQENGVWGPNPELFHARVGAFPQRMKNMYFTYLFLLRATQKIAPLLVDWDYHTPTPEEPQRIKALMESLAKTVTLTCPATFDETVMFKGPDSDALKKQFKARFRNISEILDCVSCEKCRLWGKLQINGIGTALKILFEMSENDLEMAGPRMSLQRTEIVALLNTLNRLSESIEWSVEMHNAYLKNLESKKPKAETVHSQGTKASDNASSPPPSASNKKLEAPTTPKKSTNYLLVVGLLTPVFTLLLWAAAVVGRVSSQ